MLLVLLVASCGAAAVSTTTSAVTSTSAGTTSTASTTVTSTTLPSPEEAVPVFFLAGDGGSPARSGPFLVSVARAAGSLAEAVGALVRLDPREVQEGITSAVPAGTKVNGVTVTNGVATVDLTSDFAGGGGTFSTGARLAQLVYTATAWDGVDGVRLRLDGTPVTVFSAEGLVLDDPMTRQSYEDLLPGIFVERPPRDAVVGPDLVVSGVAAAFEGVFQLEILDTGGGRVAGVPYVQTDNGMGWGSYSVTLDLSSLIAAGDTPLRIHVWEYSAKDGSVIGERYHPVVLEG